MAVAEPAQPLRLPASLSLYQRWGLGEREGDSEGSSSSVRGGLGVHTALLEARTRQRWGEGSDDVAPAGHAGRFREQANWQRCAFVLDLVIAQPPAAGAGGPVQPMRQKGYSGSGRDVAASQRGGSAAPRQADAAQRDGFEDDSSASPSWEARHEAAGAPAAAGSGMMLQGALSSRDCGIRLALAVAPIKVDEYYSKAVSIGAVIRTFQPASLAAVLLALPEAGAGALQASGGRQPLAMSITTPAHLPLKSCMSLAAAPQVNYTLMVTAMGFLQVLLLVRQMEAVSTQALASRVSLLSLAQQVGAVCRDCCHLALTGLLARKVAGAPPMARVPALPPF